MNRELIAAAVGRRLHEVRERVNALDPERFAGAGFYLSSVKEILRDEDNLKIKLSPFTVKEWAAADTDCLTALRVISLHGQKSMALASHPPAEEFLTKLKQKSAAREPLFPLLLDRYQWPLNFSFLAENEIREWLLMRVMTASRARIERNSIAAIDADDLLLLLNLIGMQACAARDLRFLDALNYYYELLPATLHPESQNAWLLISFFALYARALVSWS